MLRALDTFAENIKRVRNLGGLYSAISNMTTAAIDATDLLRAQHVLCVSALDHYVHEATRMGMVEVFSGIRPQTEAFKRFKISVSSFSSTSPINLLASDFENEVRDQHSYLSFQHPDKIADAIRLISGIDLWNSVAPMISMSPRDTKDTLKLIVDRRNKIAHEADTDPVNPGLRWPIAPDDVERSVDFVEGTVRAIHSLISCP